MSARRYRPPHHFGLGGVAIGNEFQFVTDEQAEATLAAAGTRAYATSTFALGRLRVDLLRRTDEVERDAHDVGIFDASRNSTGLASPLSLAIRSSRPRVTSVDDTARVRIRSAASSRVR